LQPSLRSLHAHIVLQTPPHNRHLCISNTAFLLQRPAYNDIKVGPFGPSLKVGAGGGCCGAVVLCTAVRCS